MAARRRAAVLAVLAVLVPVCAHAQAGRADLRYAVPMPAAVSFTSVDSISTTVSGLPTGDMTTTGTIRSVNELRFVPADGGFAITGTLHELTGGFDTPMGVMPVEARIGTSVELAVGPAGPEEEALSDLMAAPSMGDQAELLGQARAVAGLIALPGRELRIGQTWTDTMRVTPGMDGLTVDVTVVSGGTYAADTIVDGRTLNILHTTSETITNMSGSVQGMEMSQKMTVTARGRVLWDSALHIPVRHESQSETLTVTILPQQGMTMTNTARSNSLTTAQPQG